MFKTSFNISVDERPIGLAMYRSRPRGQLDSPPVEYNKHDSWQSLVLKELVRRMISYEPSDRPSAGEVLIKLQAITSEYHKKHTI